MMWLMWLGSAAMAVMMVGLGIEYDVASIFDTITLRLYTFGIIGLLAIHFAAACALSILLFGDTLERVKMAAREMILREKNK